jgi:propane monooxygenase reductase component
LPPDRPIRQTPFIAAADAFVCGPPPMLAAALTALQRRGIAPKHIHSEQFVTV